MPIGSYSADGAAIFCGHLNGAGFKVTGLWANRESENFVGLFGYSYGTIKNLGVEMSDKTFSDLDITLTALQEAFGATLSDIVGMRGRGAVGGLAGLSCGTITGCYVTGNVTGISEYAGGLVGQHGLQGRPSTIKSSYTACTVNGIVYVGGLAGSNNGGIIEDSYTTGDVISGANYAGGLVGYKEGGTVTNCYATGNVSGHRYVGGLVGVHLGGGITKSYTAGDVDGENHVGGLVGANDGISTITNCYAKGDVTATGASPTNVGGLAGGNFASISNSYATGKVTATSASPTNVGGLVGENSGGTITASFFDTDATGQTKGVGNNAEATGVYGLSTFRLKNASTYAALLEELEETAWDTDVWLVQNGYYPQLKASMCDGCAGAMHACDCTEDECACECAICAGIDAMLCPHCGVGLDESGAYVHKPCDVCGAECDGDSYVHMACPVCGDDYDTENSVHIHEICPLCDAECDGEVYVHKTCVVCDADCDGDSYVHAVCSVCGAGYDAENSVHIHETCPLCDAECDGGAYVHNTCTVCDAECDGESYVHTVCLVCGAGYDTENNAHNHATCEICGAACDGVSYSHVLGKACNPCVSHADADNDGKCDVCGAAVTSGGDGKGEGEGKDGLSGGAIAGIVLGSVAGAALVAFAVYQLLRKRKKSSSPKDPGGFTQGTDASVEDSGNVTSENNNSSFTSEDSGIGDSTGGGNSGNDSTDIGDSGEGES